MERAYSSRTELGTGLGMGLGTSQHHVDPKGPLKDKGVLTAWAKQVDLDLERIHTEMDALSAAVRSGGGYPYSLNVYSRKQSGQRSLRWRDRYGTHLTWPTVVRRMGKDGVPPAMAQWYERVQMSALMLNTQALVRRKEAKTIAELLALYLALDEGHPVSKA